MPGLLTEKWNCKQKVSVTERRGNQHDEIKLRLTYSPYGDLAEKKDKLYKPHSNNNHQLHHSLWLIPLKQTKRPLNWCNWHSVRQRICVIKKHSREINLSMRSYQVRFLATGNNNIALRQLFYHRKHLCAVLFVLTVGRDLLQTDRKTYR